MRSPSRSKSLFAAVRILIVLICCAGWGGSAERSSYEANQKGAEYMDSKRYAKAAEEFERAHTIDPENKVISGNLAVAYNQMAVELMGREKYLEARQYLEKAVALRPDEAAIRDNLTAAYEKTSSDERGERSAAEDASMAASRVMKSRSFSEEDVANEKIARDFLVRAIQSYEKKENSVAKELLGESLKYSRDNPIAFEILGDIAYFEQDLVKAKESYVSAYRLQNSARLQGKLEKVSREVPVEEKMDKYGDEHFIIRYKKNVPKPFGGGFEIRQYLREAWKAISNDFAFYPNDKVIVILYNEEEYRYLSGTPAWVGGLFDGKIRLPAYKDKVKAGDLQKLVRHELTHYFVYAISRGKCPKWLNEGLAQYEENQFAPLDLGYFRKAVKEKSLLSMEELDRGLDLSDGPVEQVLFYQQSFVIVSYLAQKYRMFKLKEMLEAYAKGKTTEQVFLENLKTTTKVFEIKWLASLKSSES